jgi:hypothetical protein
MDPLYFEALAALETAGGRKTIKGPKGEDSFNLYNIKDLNGKGYRAIDKAEGSNDAYRVYASADESTQDLIGLLSRKYPKALEATDRQQFAQTLKDGGYATDPEYVAKFVNVYDSMAARGDQPAAQTLPVSPGGTVPRVPAGRSLEDLYAAARGPRPPKSVAMTETAKAVKELGDIQPLRAPADTEAAWYTRATGEQKTAEQAVEAANNQSLLDISRAAFWGTFGADAVRWLSKPEYAPDGFVAGEKDLEGFTTDEQDALRQATSHAEYERIKFDILDYKDQMREAGKSGVGWALLGGLIAGGPEAYLTGGAATLAMARVGVGSVKLASQGRVAAAFGASAAENIGANVALTAAQDYLSPFVGTQDYVLAAAGGTLGVALHAPRVLRGSRDVESKAHASILDDAIESKKDDVALARRSLPEGADEQTVARAAGEIQSVRLTTELAAHSGDLPADRQLLPPGLMDELGDDPQVKVDGPNKMEGFPVIDAGSDAAAKAGLPEHWVNAPNNGLGVLNEGMLNTNGLRNVGSATPDNLAAGWRRGNPYGAMSIREFEAGYGVSYDALVNRAAPNQLSLLRTGNLPPQAVTMARWLHKTFLPDLRVVLMDLAETPYGKTAEASREAGNAWNIGKDISVIRLRGGDKWQHTLIHEFGHIVFDRNVSAVKHAVKDGFMDVYDAWAKKYGGDYDGGKPALGMSKATDAAVRRGPTSSDVLASTLGVKSPAGFIPSLMDVMARVIDTATGDLRKMGPDNVRFAADYIPNVKEFSAEQFTKYIEAAVADVLDWKPKTIPESVKQFFANVWQQMATLFNRIKQAGLLAPEQGVVNFFEEVRTRAAAGAERAKTGDVSFEAGTPVDRPNRMLLSAADERPDSDVIRKYGLDTLRADTPAQKAELKAMVHLYRKAEAYPMPDKTRMSKLLAAKPMQWATPTALRLMSSENPVARMAGAELLESGGGAGGRQTTASIAKWIHEREFMGNAVNDFQRHYTEWRNANGGGLREDMFGGRKWAEFNRAVATEIENRANNRTAAVAPAVKAAADVLGEAYDRMRVTQQRLKTPGWAALPKTSDGYMPHRMSPGKIRAMTPDQGRVLHKVLTEQFEGLEGFDAAFSRGLASRYLDVMRKRGTSGYSAPIGVHNAEAADIVEQAAAAMGMGKDEANALAKRVLRAQPAHTRHRLQLDLTQSYAADGKPFQLLDLFESDQLTLLRSQAGRVSGESALIRHGIPGSTGLKLLRRAMDFGTAKGKADNATLEAFDQVSAELLGQPFGKHEGLWMQRATQFNSLASLGGIGFNQLAETLNGAVSLGVRHALASVGSFARLRAEILALSKGQKVNNPVIGSLETYGAEFGTDPYKMVFPFDMPERMHETYGTETITAADRLLRSGVNLQGKLSLWRAISSAQTRGMAEQIVHKALRFIRNGEEDKALSDMGIDPNVMASIRKELPDVAKFDARGKLVEFDITKLQDRAAADAFVQAVHRGTQQIIQGSFIGETGKWAHSGLLKLMMQFRTFSLIAIDKQWNRQVGNHGTAKALGLLLGTMSFAAPIYMVRTGIQSIGRPDQDAFLERQLHPMNIARQTLNYVALSGLSGDLLDALTAVAGYNPTGGRSGTTKSFVGNVIAPAAGKANDIWGAIQNQKEGTDLHALIQQLPFSRLPWLYPAVNALKPEK